MLITNRIQYDMEGSLSIFKTDDIPFFKFILCYTSLEFNESSINSK